MDSKRNDKDCKSLAMSKKLWTEAEKNILLKGLKKYGSKDLANLKSLLPNKSLSCIEQIIRKYQTLAELGKKDVNSPLDIWLRSGVFEKDNLVSDALLFISLFEHHPLPEETAGFDLRLAYKFLHEASKGQTLTNLPLKTAEMFRKLMMTVDKDLWPANEYNTTDYLIGKLCKIKSDKCYVRKKPY